MSAIPDGDAPARLLPAAGRAALPWKNGGGLTREVAVHPPASDLSSFDWRVSIAEVRHEGAFSVFSGVDRCMAVLAGRLILTVHNEPAVHLTPDSEPRAFAGDVPVFARPSGGTVLDLNVMTRRGRFAARMGRREATRPTTLVAPAGATTLIVALTELHVHCAARQWSVGPHDALLLDGPAPYEVRPLARPAAFFVIELSAPRSVHAGQPW